MEYGADFPLSRHGSQSVAPNPLSNETLDLTQVLGGVIVLAAIGIVVRSAGASAGEELAESAAETDAT
jgi:hypothetical protein